MGPIATEDKTEAPPDQAQKPKVNPPGRIPWKLKRFQKLLLKNPGESATEIAFRVYDCKDRNSARSIAAENLRKLGISRQEIMERAGLTDEEDAKDLARLRKAKKVVSAVITGKDAGAADHDFIDVDDNGTQLKALELTYKVKGVFNDEKIGAGDQMSAFLEIVEKINLANMNRPDKGITIEQSESPNLNKYLAK